MRIVATTIAVWLALAVQNAHAAPCDASVAAVIERTDAIFERVTRSGRNVFLQHPAVRNLIVFCGVEGDAPKEVGGEWNDLYPSRDFFTVLGEAGSVVTLAPSSRIETAIWDCYKHAIASKGERGSGSQNAGLARVTCNTTRPFGGSVLVTISRTEKGG